MKYFWSILFIIWPVAALVFCALSPALGWWFPERTLADGSVSTASVNPLGREIDHLFHVILWITAIVFVLTHIVLAWALIKGVRRSDSNRPRFIHGDNRLEVIWTVVPAMILLFIAYDQLDVWAKFRVVESFPEAAQQSPLAEIEAHQFGWHIRYPKPGTNLAETAQPGDIHDNDRLIVPVGRPVLIWLRTRDVQHSFYVPEFRIKQDALPGQVIPVWFQVDEAGDYPFLCAELCGWGHYKMGGMIEARAEDEYSRRFRELTAENQNDGVDEQAE